MENHPPTAPSRQLFSASADVLVRWSVALTVVIAGGLVFGTYYGYRSDWWQGRRYAPDQPVLFSHRHHAEQLRIDCRFCHTSVENSSFAGMPATETCMTCHSGIFTDSPMLAPVVDSARTGIPMRWNRVNNLPDYVYFEHSVHVTHGIGCTTCHGEVGNHNLMQKAQTLHMTWCLDCHRDPAPFIRQQENVFSSTAPERSELPLEERLALVHRLGLPAKNLTDCTTCHR